MATYRVPVLEDFAWQPPVLDLAVNATVHSNVSKGDRYLVIATASDMFVGEENNIATATISGASAAGDWIFDSPAEGWTVFDKDSNKVHRYDGAAWAVEDLATAASQVLLLESEMSQVESRVLVLESEMSQQISDLLVEKSTVNAVSEAVSQTISDLLVEKSTVNAVSELLSQVDSQLLLIESEAASNDSEILLLESRMSVVEISQASVASRVLVLESEMSVVQADKQDKGTYVAEYGAIQFTI